MCWTVVNQVVSLGAVLLINLKLFIASAKYLSGWVNTYVVEWARSRPSRMTAFSAISVEVSYSGETVCAVLAVWVVEGT